jgi:hypothetical protein
MSLREAYVGVRIIETADNYALADAPLNKRVVPQAAPHNWYFAEDPQFWSSVLKDPKKAWDAVLPFHEVYLSEWVARVPGLFWKPGSEQLRRLSIAAVESRSQNWTVYNPRGKSMKVMGGVGTLRLPPAADGYRLASLTTSLNASAGVPALVAPEVWDKIRRGGACEGCLLSGSARWQAMDETWAARFPSTENIPRGYLVLDQPDAIEIYPHWGPIQIHPFTIMEYAAGSKELFDFVYAQADTGSNDYRGRLQEFFGGYKNANERFGRYLLEGDMVDPLWEAEFMSPADLRRADPSARSQLELLEKRVAEHQLGQDTIELLLEKLAETCPTPDEVRVLSEEIGIKAALWLAGGSLAEICSQFMDEVVRRQRVETLIDKLAQRHPGLFAA